ncbi:MAG: hypothetical protein HN368_18320 [Spirochaetales bacterium]|nr:hypothetical protein [Spirochaetales bacterium]
MKRIKKHSALSITLLSIGSVLLAMLFVTGSLAFLVGTPLFVIAGLLARKSESWDSYRTRYEERYGMDITEEKQK